MGELKNSEEAFEHLLKLWFEEVRKIPPDIVPPEVLPLEYIRLHHFHGDDQQWEESQYILISVVVIRLAFSGGGYFMNWGPPNAFKDVILKTEREFFRLFQNMSDIKRVKTISKKSPGSYFDEQKNPIKREFLEFFLNNPWNHFVPIKDTIEFHKRQCKNDDCPRVKAGMPCHTMGKTCVKYADPQCKYFFQKLRRRTPKKITNVCPICHEEFTSSRSDKLTCGKDSCRKAFYREHGPARKRL